MFKNINLTVLLACYLFHKPSHSLPTSEVTLPSLNEANSPEEILSKIENADLEKVTDLKLPPEDSEEKEIEQQINISLQKQFQPLLAAKQRQQFEGNGFLPLFPASTGFNNLRNVRNVHEQNVLDNLRLSYGLDRINPSSISEELVLLAQPQMKEERPNFAEEVIPFNETPMSKYGNDNIKRSFSFEPLDPYDDFLVEEYKTFVENNKLSSGDYVELLNPYLNSRTQQGRSLDVSVNGRSFNGAEDDDMDTAESSAAMFRPMFTYRYQKAKKVPPKPPKRRVSGGSKRRRPSMRYPVHYT